MKRLFFFSMLLSAFSAASAGPCSAGSGCPASWSNVTVARVGSGLHQAGARLFLNVDLETPECQNATGTGGSEYLTAYGTDALAIARIQGMKATLLSASVSGMSIRARWTGDYCWIDDIILCTDAACDPF